MPTNATYKYDSLRTPPATDAYREGWERTFGGQKDGASDIEKTDPSEQDLIKITELVVSSKLSNLMNVDPVEGERDTEESWNKEHSFREMQGFHPNKGEVGPSEQQLVDQALSNLRMQERIDFGMRSDIGGQDLSKFAGLASNAQVMQLPRDACRDAIIRLRDSCGLNSQSLEQNKSVCDSDSNSAASLLARQDRRNT